MQRAIVRIFAVILMLGQAVQLTGGAFCGLQRRHHAAHCDGAMQAAGPSVTAASSQSAPAPCDLMGSCGTPVPAITAAVSVAFGFGDPSDIAQHIASPLHSFTAAPIPPPPQG